MRNRKSIDALSVGAICVAAGIVALSAWNLPPRFDTSVYAELGRVLANEAISVTPPHGEVIVIARDTQAYPQPAMDAALRAIHGLPVDVTTKLIQLDPLRPVEVPPGDFYEVIRRAKAGQVIVSLLGPPVLEAEQRAKLGPNRPKIVALCTGSLSEETNLRDLFKEGLLHAAVVNRKTTGEVATASARFDQLYQVLKGNGEAVAARPL